MCNYIFVLWNSACDERGISDQQTSNNLFNIYNYIVAV